MRFKIHSVIPCIYKRDYSTGGNRGRGGEGKCYIQTYIHTDRHTDPPTKWVLEEHALLKKYGEER